jgi:hypothetical protein
MSAALALLPVAARAQSTASPPAAVPPATPASLYGITRSHWIVSGFVGSNYGGSAAADPSVNFGGQLAYMWKGVIGAEALADFAPSLKIDNLALAAQPQVNSYMANIIFAIPLGAEGQFQPYISGGVGGIQLRAAVFNLALANPTGTPPTGTSDGDRAKLGTDLGGGVMGFAGTVGFRADVRYYKVPVDTTLQSTSAVGLFTEGLLSGLSIWRANIGVAVRW